MYINIEYIWCYNFRKCYNMCIIIVSGASIFQNASTCISTLNISGLAGLSVNSKVIYNFLFNNTWGIHGDTTDFNAITTAGYKFVRGYLNSPNPTNQGFEYYSWLIGLGTDYPINGANSYGCQFAVQRGTPRLHIRYNEFNSWGSWSGVIGGSADAFTSGN
jgi:hypothetical protein